FSHACSAFAVALFTWVWLRVRGEWRAPRSGGTREGIAPAGMAALAAAGALMVMVREQDAFFAVAAALDYAVSVVGSRRREAGGRRSEVAGRLLGGLAAGVCFLLVYTPQLASY